MPILIKPRGHYPRLWSLNWTQIYPIHMCYNKYVTTMNNMYNKYSMYITFTYSLKGNAGYF